MKPLRTAVRLTLFGVHLIVGVLLCVFVLPADWNKPGLARRHGVVRWWLGACTRLAGIRVEVHGRPTEGASLVVANHVSWMDIVVVGGLQPLSFLSKSEIARWPVVGYLARKAGTLFINRGAGAETATRVIGERLRTGASVIFFPEGTTSDGVEIRRFHPRLFTAAIDAGVPVQPVSISYPCENSLNGVNPKAPYRNAAFLPHALSVIGESRVRAVVRYASSVPSNGDRRRLAEKARELMVAEHRKKN